MKGTILVLIGTLCVPACAGHQPPAIPAATELPPLIISEALADPERICVVRDPFNDYRLACISVGALRRLLRSQVDAHVEASR